MSHSSVLQALILQKFAEHCILDLQSHSWHVFFSMALETLRIQFG